MTYEGNARDMLTDIRFWQQVLRDSERTIMCSPELESRVKTMLAAHGWDRLTTVRTNRFLPDDTILLVDEHARAAAAAELMSRPIRLTFGDGDATS